MQEHRIDDAGLTELSDDMLALVSGGGGVGMDPNGEPKP